MEYHIYLNEEQKGGQMKASSIFYALLTFILFSSVCFGEDFRMWTEADGKRKIEACIIDKGLDGGGARLALRNGKTFWIEAEKLSKMDREYIRDWVKPMDHITAKLIGSGKGRKKVKVKIVAGTQDLVIKAYYTEKKKQPKGYPKIFNVKRGETSEFTYTAGNDYIIKAFHNKKEIEFESWRKKTGSLQAR